MTHPCVIQAKGIWNLWKPQYHKYSINKYRYAFQSSCGCRLLDRLMIVSTILNHTLKMRFSTFCQFDAKKMLRFEMADDAL